MKIGNENASHVLNILYANNNFEPTITCDPMINFQIFTLMMHMTQILKNHNINNEIMRFNINKKV
jgi:hypothetical protein